MSGAAELGYVSGRQLWTVRKKTSREKAKKGASSGRKLNELTPGCPRCFRPCDDACCRKRLSDPLASSFRSESPESKGFTPSNMKLAASSRQQL